MNSPFIDTNFNINVVDENEYAKALRYIERNEKKYTDQIRIDDMIGQTELARNLCFLKINGISDFFKREEIEDFNIIMRDIISGFYNEGSIFGYLITGENSFLNLYIALNKEYVNSLRSSLVSYFPFIDIDSMEGKEPEIKRIIVERAVHGGVISGIPTNKMKGENASFQIEKICRTMNGDSWGILVLAKSIESNSVQKYFQNVMEALTNIAGNIKSSFSNFGGVGTDVINYEAKRYSEVLEKLLERLQRGTTSGMWTTTAYYFAKDNIICNKLKNSIVSVFNGEDSTPCRIQCIDLIKENAYQNVIGNLIAQFPMLKWKVTIPYDKIIPNSLISEYRYQTALTSEELGVFFEVPRKEYPGFHIEQYVEFEVTERRKFNNINTPEDEPFAVGEIINGREVLDNSKDINEYKIKLGDLNRHVLIIGITGGGKSNTSKNLLKTLYGTHKKPFLILESAKREYWELRNIKGFEKLNLFTLGGEDRDSIPYRVNPFEVVHGNIQTHIDLLLSTFKASFELYPPMPFVLETSLYEIYQDRGWNIITNENSNSDKSYPTLDDLYFKVDTVIKRLGYSSEIESNVRAGLQARIYSLMDGSKGRMLNTNKSIPIDKLLSTPTVFELEDIGDDDVKAFVIGIILVHLYEYRKSIVGTNTLLDHVVVIEEAHRLLKNVSESGGPNPKAKAVEFFCNLLAEIRSYGQGIIIADQIPTKLTPDTLKNTNLKIIHRTVMQEDREAVGKSMNMTEDQIEYLSVLKRGYAAVFSEGDTRPKLVKMPLVTSEYSSSRQEVISQIRDNMDLEIKQLVFKSTTNNTVCENCKFKCLYGDKIKNSIEELKSAWDEYSIEFNHSIDNYIMEGNIKGLIKYIEEIITTKVSKLYSINNKNEKICFMSSILYEFSDVKEKADYLIELCLKELEGLEWEVIVKGK